MPILLIRVIIKVLKLFTILNRVFKSMEKIVVKKNLENKSKLKKVINLLNKCYMISKSLYNNNLISNFFKWKFLIFFSEIFLLYKNLLLLTNIKNHVTVLKKITNIYFITNDKKHISGFIINTKKKIFYSFLIHKSVFINKRINNELWKLIDLLSVIKKRNLIFQPEK
nr:hypothetical protein CcurKRNrm3_p130 [Cryptomonas curvata]